MWTSHEGHRAVKMSSQKEPRYCCVPQCTPYTEPISLHRFPADNDLRDKWVAAIKRECHVGDEFEITFGTPVCGKHFKASDFRWIPGGSRKHLCWGAVPSVFTSTIDEESLLPPKKRLKLTERVSTTDNVSDSLKDHGSNNSKKTFTQKSTGELSPFLGRNKNQISTKECQSKVKHWLMEKLESGEFPGLVWLDDEQSAFRVPWSFFYGSRVGQRAWEAHPSYAFYKEWSKVVPGYKEGNSIVSLRQFMKRALDDNPNIIEDIPKSSMNPLDSFRVFMFRQENESISLRDRSHSFFGPWCKKLGIKQYDMLCGKVSIYPKDIKAQNGLILEIYNYWLKKGSTMQVLQDWLSHVLPGHVSRSILGYVVYLNERKRNHEACGGPKKAEVILNAIFRVGHKALDAAFPVMYKGPQNVTKKCKVIITPEYNLNSDSYPGPNAKQQRITRLMILQGIPYPNIWLTNGVVLELYHFWRKRNAPKAEFIRWLKNISPLRDVTENVLFSRVEEIDEARSKLKNTGTFTAVKGLERRHFSLSVNHSTRHKMISFQCNLPTCTRRVRHVIGSKSPSVQQRLCSHHVNTSPEKCEKVCKVPISPPANVDVAPPREQRLQRSPGDASSSSVVSKSSAVRNKSRSPVNVDAANPGQQGFQRNPGDASSSIVVARSLVVKIKSRAPPKKLAVPHSGWQKLQEIQQSPEKRTTPSTRTRTHPHDKKKKDDDAATTGPTHPDQRQSRSRGRVRLHSPRRHAPTTHVDPAPLEEESTELTPFQLHPLRRHSAASSLDETEFAAPIGDALNSNTMPDISDVCIICNMMLEKPTNHINLDTMVLSSSKTTGQQTVRVRLEQVLGHPPRGSSWLCSMCHSTLVQIEEYNCLLALFRVQYQTSDQLRLEACDLKEGADIPGNNEQHISAGDALWTLLSDKDSASKKPPASVLTLSPLNQENCILEKIGKKSFPYISQILEQQESVTADSAGMVVVKQEVCNDHHQAGVANGDVPAMDITDSYGVNFSSDNGANPQVAKKEFGYTPSLLQGEMGGAISSCLPVDSGLGEDYVSNAAISHEPEAHPAEPVVVTPDSSELDTSLSAAQPLCVVQDVCSLGIKIKEDPAGGERTLGNGALQEWEKDGMCDHPSDTAAGAVVPGMLPFEGSITKTLPCKEDSSESSVSHGYSDTSLQTGQLLTHLLTSQPTVLEIIPKLE